MCVCLFKYVCVCVRVCVPVCMYTARHIVKLLEPQALSHTCVRHIHAHKHQHMRTHMHVALQYFHSCTCVRAGH